MKPIPYVDLPTEHRFIKHQLLEAVGKVIDHGQFILGKEVEEFESKFAQLCGVKYAIGVNSGTDALILALKSLGIGQGDEVITPPNSFVASTSCIALTQATPVFVDVREDYNINPELIEQAITPRTRAILPVHLTGRPADMDPIMSIAEKHNIYVIEDSAQAIMAKYKDKSVGSIGTIGAFSLHPVKTLNACGDGGMITTNDSDLYETLKIFRNLGLKNRNECVLWGHNSRLDTIQAAMLLVKLQYLDEWTNKRIELSHFYQSELSNITGLVVPTDKHFEKAVYHTFVVLAEDRDRLVCYLNNRGIGTSIHYPTPIHKQSAMKNISASPLSFPVTEYQSNRILSLPIYPHLTESSQKYIAESIQQFYSN
tara:strand:- start:3480 stop:4586 length:1107 start_codon:yes stop_codon:yes gene_type:complete